MRSLRTSTVICRGESSQEWAIRKLIYPNKKLQSGSNSQASLSPRIALIVHPANLPEYTHFLTIPPSLSKSACTVLFLKLLPLGILHCHIVLSYYIVVLCLRSYRYEVDLKLIHSKYRPASPQLMHLLSLCWQTQSRYDISALPILLNDLHFYITQAQFSN